MEKQETIKKALQEITEYIIRDMRKKKMMEVRSDRERRINVR